MLALASLALSLPAQQQQQAILPENSTAILPENSTAPLPELAQTDNSTASIPQQQQQGQQQQQAQGQQQGAGIPLQQGLQQESDTSLNLLTHFRAWTCGERMYRLAPNSTTHGGCPKFSVPILEKLECDKAVCSAMAPGKEMNPYNVDNKEGAGAGKYHVRAARPLAAPSPPADPRAPRSPGRRGRSARTTTSGRRAATARPTRPTSRTRSTAPTRRW